MRTFGIGEYQETQDGDPLWKQVSAGFGADGKFRSFTRLRLAHESVANAGEVFDRDRLYYQVNFGVSRLISYVGFDGWIGDDVDFSQNRPGKGASVNTNLQLRPGEHLALSLTTGMRWLNLDQDRLFTSQVERLRATYTFNARMFVRAIVQNQRTNSDRLLYGDNPNDPTDDVDQHGGSLAAQLLAAYKLNWQTVFYVGFGDLQEVVGQQNDFLHSNRQFFAKISYAFQR